MSDSIKNVEEKNGVVVISTNGYFNNIAGDAVLEVFNEKMESGSKKFLIDISFFLTLQDFVQYHKIF